jgi:hypothetical protein
LRRRIVATARQRDRHCQQAGGRSPPAAGATTPPEAPHSHASDTKPRVGGGQRPIPHRVSVVPFIIRERLFGFSPNCSPQ